MTGYKLLFVIMFLWSLVYMLSYFTDSVANKRTYQAVSSIAVSLIGTALCVVYIIYC